MANDDILNDLNNANELDKVYNIVKLGTGDSARTIIDMTHKGDTPATKTSEVVEAIVSEQILSGHEAWSSTGVLVAGTCTYNNDTSGDTVEANYVVYPRTFHTNQGGTNPVEGNIVEQRGNTTITIQADTIGIEEGDICKIYSKDSGEHQFIIPQGVYGNSLTEPITPTTITIEGIYAADIKKGKHIFGVEGTLNDQILPVEEYYKQHGIHYVGEYEYELQDTTAYAGMLKVKIPAIPLTEEQPAGSTAYTLYIGQSNP